MPVFLVEIAAIFAREVLEGVVIIGQYRRVVKAQEDWEEARTNAALRTIWLAAAGAAAFALLLIIGLGIGLNAAGDQLSDKVVEIIEGISKLVAAVCIAQLSLKIPVWMGVYPKPEKTIDVGLTKRELAFNVGWNIWREVAEVGAFLIPFFLNDDQIEAIPVSGLVGIVIGLVSGGLLYLISRVLKDKRYLAFFLAFVTGWLSTGLFTGGAHEIEEVAGETPKVWVIDVTFFSNSEFPFALLKPFGWSHKPTVLWIVAFIVWAILLIAAHVVYYYWLKKKAAEKDAADKNAACTDETEQKDEIEQKEAQV